MSFEGAVISTGVLVIASILAAFVLSERKSKEPDTTLTRLEQQYFEPEVYEAQQAQIKAERERRIKIAEEYISARSKREEDKNGII